MTTNISIVKDNLNTHHIGIHIEVCTVYVSRIPHCSSLLEVIHTKGQQEQKANIGSFFNEYHGQRFNNNPGENCKRKPGVETIGVNKRPKSAEEQVQNESKSEDLEPVSSEDEYSRRTSLKKNLIS